MAYFDHDYDGVFTTMYKNNLCSWTNQKNPGDGNAT